MKHLLLAATALLLAACESHPTRTVYVDDDAQQVVTQPAMYGTPGATVIHDHSDNGSGLVQGMILGHMLSSSSGSNNSGGYSGGKRTKKTTIINNHTTVVQRPASRSSYSSPSRSSYRPSTFRSSSSMSSRAVRRR
jgi:hypothetical protein